MLNPSLLQNDGGGLSELELAQAIGRSVIDGILGHTLTSEQVYHKARLAGSFARRHLEAKAREQAVAENIRRGFQVIASGFTGEKLDPPTPEPEPEDDTASKGDEEDDTQDTGRFEDSATYRQGLIDAGRSHLVRGR